MAAQDKIIESLAGLVPEDARGKVSSAVSSILEDLHAEYEEAYNAKLREAYELMAEENAENVANAKAGYEEAYDIIADLRERLEKQNEEFEQILDEEFEEAYQMILSERSKNEDLGNRLYEEYEERLDSIKEYMVDRIDDFLSQQGEKFYEMAKQDVLNDPYLAEHKVAFDKIMDVVGDYISDEEVMFNTSSKLENLSEQVSKLGKEKRMLEAKIMRLESDNNQLNEVANEAQKMLEEQIMNEEREWVRRSKSAEGRGEVADQRRQVLLSEYASEDANYNTNHNHKGQSDQATIVEQWQALAGLSDEE